MSNHPPLKLIHSRSARASSPRRRLLLFEDNTRGVGGHYWELADLLAKGSRTLGFDPYVVVNSRWDERTTGSFRKIFPAFDVRRMNRWSLGVDGSSVTRRDGLGNPIGRTFIHRSYQRFRDHISRFDRRPQGMLRRWSEACYQALDAWNPQAEDELLVNTCDDFLLLALSQAVGRLPIRPMLNISLLFHFPLFSNQGPGTRSGLYGAQVRDCINQMRPHRVGLFATTGSLAEQMQANALPATPVPYPTRATARDESNDRCHHSPVTQERLRIVMAGMPRPEKGRSELRGLVEKLHSDPITRKAFCVSLQLPAKRWKRFIPPNLHDAVKHQRQCGQPASEPTDSFIEVKEDNLSTNDYHTWINSSDIALLMYEPNRYFARCSGVLLEMMIRGVPVLVPNHCWLAEKVTSAADHHPIGLLFNHPSEVPEKLIEIKDHYAEFSAAAQRHARVIAAEHDATETLRQMGISTTSRCAEPVSNQEILARLAS